MIEISAETREESDIHIRIIKNEENKSEIWLKIHDIQDKLGVKNMSDLTIKEIEGIYNKKRKNLTRQEREKYKACADDGFIYILDDIALKLIMNCRGSEEKEKVIEFRSKLRYDITMI